MANKSNKSVADSLETDEVLLPHMPFLLQDMWALGSSVQQIMEMTGELNLSAGDITVLDLGCGKGAVSVLLASKFGYKVTGVDFMAPFLKDAREKAEEYHVSHLCEFIRRDIIEYASAEHDFDIVILASLGGVFGTIRETVSRLRSQVKNGGYMMIDDGYLKDAGSSDRKGYEHCRDHANSVNELTHYHDRLVKEESTTELNAALNEEYLTVIRKRGEELAEQHPELKKNLTAYIQLQEEECEYLNTRVEGALWLLQKNS